jgi:site-specific DNA-methyltransferase (adenine-specific)
MELYTYRGDLVLDPFAGSGTTAVAALRCGRHYAGYDLDESYIRLAEARVAGERQSLEAWTAAAEPSAGGDLAWRPLEEGRTAHDMAREAIEAAGFTDVRENQSQPGGVEVSFTARDGAGDIWLFEVSGGFTHHRPGLQRTDALWKAIGKAAVLHQVGPFPLVILTAALPVGGSPGAAALQHVTGPGRPVRAVVDVTTRSGREQLRALWAH